MDIDLLRQGIILYLILVGSISIHEWAHAITADKLGDHTPRSQDRVTLNPISHIDMIGTVFIPLFFILGPAFGIAPGFLLIGWGKPVQVDPRNFRQPVRDDIYVTMAGPLSNLAICLTIAVIGGILVRMDPGLAELFMRIILLNATLATFNMVPIPPLDGSHLLRHAVGMSDETYYNLARFGFIILIVLINIAPFRAALWQAIMLVASPFWALFQLIGFQA